MTTNILVQEITPSGLSQPQEITLNGRPTCDRIQHTLREVLKSDNIFLLNQELFENISAASYNSTTFKYYRTNITYPEAGDLVCRNGAILSTKHEPAGQTLDFAGKHEELGTEECDKLLNRLPQIEDAKSASSSDSVPLPVVEKVLPSESAQQGHAKKVKTHHKTEKPLRAHHSFSDLRPGSQCLAFDFNQPVQQTEVQVKSKPDLPEGEWRWVTSTRVVYSANRFPGATEYKLSLGPIVLEDGTTERIKEEFVFSTAVVDIDSVHFEYTRSPVIMVVFNQRVKSKLNMYCVDVAMKPYAPTEDVKTLFKTASIIDAYEKAIENGMTVRFFKPERWPLNSQELTFIVDSGSHSEEGPLPSKGIKHKAYLTSTFNIRPLQWTQIPVSTNPIFQFSLPIHPECIATIKDYITVTTEVEDIIVQGDRVCIQVPQKEVEFDVTFKHSLMSTDGIILGNDFKRTYKKFRGMLCVPTGNAKVTNVATPALQMIAGSSKCEYSISSASFDQNLMPQVGTSLGGGEAQLPDMNHEMRIFTIDLAQYFVAERKLLAIIIPNQGTYYVQRTDWIVDTFAHENGIEVSVYTKDLKPVNNPTIVHNNEKGQLVTVKDKMIIPANVTSFKVLADGDWAVFSVPEVVPGNKQNIDLYTTTDRGLNNIF